MSPFFSLKRQHLTLAALVVLLLVLSVVRPLAVPDEGRYSEIGRWMLQSGDWLTPRLNGIPFFHKPPYLYWLEASSLAVFGAHPWATRLVIALHASAMLIGLYWGVSRLWGERLAMRACWMFGTSLAFLVGGQYVNHDMLVASWIGLAIWCLSLSFMVGQRVDLKLARWGMACCALGFLSKGLIGLVLPGAVIFFWLMLTGQWRKMLAFPWLSGMLIFAVIAVPWFVLAEQSHGGMFQYMFGHHQIDRFGATTFNNGRPWWFYWVCLLVLMFPWAFFALRTAWAQVRGQLSVRSIVQRQGLALMWTWLLVIVVFFSLPNSKLIGYVLPVMPALAVLSALGWDSLFEVRRWSSVFNRRAVLTTGVLAAVLAVVASVLAGQYTQKKAGSQDVAEQLACRMQAGERVYALGQFPYELPFYIRATQPMVVIQDWPTLRKTAGDNWRRELFEGADFDAKAATVLQTPDVLPVVATQTGNWLVATDVSETSDQLRGWTLVFKGHNWSLYQSAVHQNASVTEICK